LARSHKNSLHGLNALIAAGERGAKVLVAWLRDPGSADRDAYENTVLHVLYGYSSARSDAVAAAGDACFRRNSFRDIPYEIAAEADNSLLRDHILEKAFTAGLFRPDELVDAIKGLAKFDSRRAIDAINSALKAHPNIERELCRMLVDCTKMVFT
jgi:hypothetical protein